MYSGSSSLTYEPFYGLHENPFSLSADPRFLFRSSAHGPAFNELLAGIRRREGLIVLTGEIGTGKTTLCRSLLQHLDRGTFAAFVSAPFVSREDLLKTLLVDFGVISIGDLARGRFDGASRSDLSCLLYEFLDSLVPLKAFAVVVIDEAQNLSLPLLEEIRILSESERRGKLLQVVLVGQPELQSSLQLPQMRQVNQRVSVRCELEALDANSVAGYVDHRLRVAGCGESRVVFTQTAIEAIHEGSSGVPRLINRICDRALQHAFGSQSTQLDAHFVWAAIDDLGLSARGGIQDRAPRESPADTSARPSIADRPAQLPPPTLITLTSAELETALDGFPSENGDGLSDRTSIHRPALRRRWIVVAAASFLAVSASVGAAGWYARARSIDGAAMAAMVPPRPAHVVRRPALPVPASEPVSPPSLPEGSAVPVSPAELAAAVASSQRGRYTILVASFKTRERAERVVEELTNAGYDARAVELDGGSVGRLMQVMVTGYTSATDVQRDLQQIRQLPGGYTDARIVERE